MPEQTKNAEQEHLLILFVFLYDCSLNSKFYSVIRLVLFACDWLRITNPQNKFAIVAYNIHEIERPNERTAANKEQSDEEQCECTVRSVRFLFILVVRYVVVML